MWGWWKTYATNKYRFCRWPPKTNPGTSSRSRLGRRSACDANACCAVMTAQRYGVVSVL